MRGETVIYGINAELYQQWLSLIIKTDLGIQNWLQSVDITWLRIALAIITSLGSPAGLVLISLLVFIILIKHEQRSEAVFSYLCLISTWTIMKVLKNYFERARPLGETYTTATGFSFPSGHAMLSLAYYGFLLLLLQKYYPRHKIALRVTCVLIILAIGFSRIYLNVHFTSDVLGGYFFGALLLAVNWHIYRLYQK